VGFHSTYEGLGLPPLEAWALGTPAVRPGLPSLDEVLDGVPGRMASLDRCALDAALAEVRDLDDRRVAEVRARVRARFDWSDVAARVLEQYRRAQSRCVAR
jgi:glycosyltransferase involved in cell wall biosynthesis